MVQIKATVTNPFNAKKFIKSIGTRSSQLCPTRNFPIKMILKGGIGITCSVRDIECIFEVGTLFIVHRLACCLGGKHLNMNMPSECILDSLSPTKCCMCL